MSKIRTGFFILIAFLISLGVVWDWHYLHLPTTLPIRVVKVVGEYQFVDEGVLESAVLPYVATGFFNVNIRGAELALLKTPGVSRAALRRVWPDKIEIQVTEKKAQATLPDGEIYATDGSVFMPLHAKNLSQLPIFAGAIEDLPAIASFYNSAEFLLMKDGFHVDFVGCDGLGSWTIGVIQPNNDANNNANNNAGNNNSNINMTIILGRDHLLQKLTRFSQNYLILEKTNQGKIPTLVDLRYNLGFAAEYH